MIEAAEGRAAETRAAWGAALERLEADGLRRALSGGGAGTEVERGGRLLLNLAGNDYLGLATDPRLARAAGDAAATYGVGASASRLLSGNHPIHEELEYRLAEVKGTERALVFSSGYQTNVGVVSTLVGRHDTVIADELCHASLLDGVRLSGADLVRHQHADISDLRRALSRVGSSDNRTLVITEGVFSMEGTIPDLASIAAECERAGAILLVDDAHGTGVTGPSGHGTVSRFGLEGADIIQVGTLSKALGCQGGFVAGPSELIDILINRARSFIFSTGLSPMMAAAALEALRISGSPEGEQRRADLKRHVGALRDAAGNAGLPVLGDPDAPVSAVLIGDAGKTVKVAEEMAEGGTLASAVRPPAVPPGRSRVRFSPMATHTDEQIALAAAALEGTIR